MRARREGRQAGSAHRYSEGGNKFIATGGGQRRRRPRPSTPAEKAGDQHGALGSTAYASARAAAEKWFLNPEVFLVFTSERGAPITTAALGGL